MLLVCAQAALAQQPAEEDADRLYASRANPASARRAAELWNAAVGRNPKDFVALWKLSRADYWIGGHSPEADGTARWEDGLVRAQLAVAVEPNRPEGHFWMAANMGALAERSTRAGLKYRKAIKEELEVVLRLDPGFQQGSADRALGRWYFKVPRLLGGNKRTAESHLLASLKYNAHSTASNYFLAELMLDDGRREEARSRLQAVIDAPFDPDWDPENQDFKAKARSLLASLK
jgi:hypothetical protein